MSQINSKFPPTFIVGTSRSGTTVLRNLLAANPQVISFPESKFFQRLAGYQHFGLVHPKMQKSMAIFISRLPQDLKDHIETKVPIFFLSKSWVRYFVGLLDQMARAENKELWIEKTPEHLHQIPLIKSYLPMAKFIHIKRNSSDVVASIYERSRTKWQRPLSVDHCINRCKWDEAIHQKYKNEKNHIFVSYEMLCGNTRAELEKICAFLQLDFSDRMLSDYQQMQEKLAPHSAGHLHQKLMQPIQNYNDSTFNRIFTPEEQQYILDKLENK